MDKVSRDFVMAKLYFKNKDYTMAEKSFKDHLSTNPDDVAALKLLAQVYEQNKRFDKAFDMYERCYLAEPDRTGVLLDICRILLLNDVNLQRVDQRKWLDLAIRFFPSNPIVINLKSVLFTLPDNPPLRRTEVPSEDPLTKILEKLSLMESRLERIEEKLKSVGAVATTNSVSTGTNDTTRVEAKDTPPKTSPPKTTPKPIENPVSEKSKSSDMAPMFAQATFKPSLFSPMSNSSLFSLSSTTSAAPTTATTTTTTTNSTITATNPVSTGNLFSESIAKLNIPTSGAFSGPFNFSNSGFSTTSLFSSFKPENSQGDNEEQNEEEEEVVPNEELPIEGTCDMTPIELKTGEENEDVLFENRCKLFRLRDQEYKERGLGSIKVLKNRETGKGRLIMRRDAIGLVCLNCWDLRKIVRVRDTQIRWAGVDASEDGKPAASVFLVKFKTQELTDKFMSLVTDLYPEDSESSDQLSQRETSVTTEVEAKETPPKVSPKPVENSVSENSKSSGAGSKFAQATFNPSLFSPIGNSPLFGSSSATNTTNPVSTGNLFSESMAKLNIPTTGAFSSSFTGPFGFSNSVFSSSSLFSSPKPGNNQGDEAQNEEEEEVVPNEELPIEGTCDMTPIELKTGEENEDVLFENRCKLFRLRDQEYKERGLGSIKVLKNRETGKGRLIMRRDAIGLVCLNCWDLRKIDRVRDTQIRWAGVDASEDGKPAASVFLVKFKTQELTDKFMSLLTNLYPDDSDSSNQSSQQAATDYSQKAAKECLQKSTVSTRDDSVNDKPDIELIYPKLDQSLVEKARKLQLPDLFYHQNQDPCKGCNGCKN